MRLVVSLILGLVLRAAFGLALLAAPLTVVGGGTAMLELVATPDHLPAALATGRTGVTTPAGMVAVYGHLTGADFAVAGLNQVTVENAAGEPLPLQLDTTNQFEDFGEIVGLWCCFLVPAAAATPGTRYTLRWGDDLVVENIAVEGLAFAESDLPGIRGFRLQFAAVAGDPQALTSLQIIADSSADYSFLWYLLPMAVLFALLTIRRIRGYPLAD